MKKILHVEDDSDFLTYIKFILEDIAVITQAVTLAQAQQLIKDYDFDLVLLDLTLPDGSGMTIASQLMQDHPEIPIVVFSSHKQTSNLNHVSKTFQKGYFSETSLINAIRVLTA